MRLMPLLHLMVLLCVEHVRVEQILGESINTIPRINM